jgi:hypothetical protein
MPGTWREYQDWEPEAPIPSFTWPWQRRLWHVSYLQDCGYGAVMECVVPVTSTPWEIRRRWPAVAHEQNPGKAIQDAFDHRPTDIHKPGSQNGDCPLCDEMKG